MRFRPKTSAVPGATAKCYETLEDVGHEWRAGAVSSTVGGLTVHSLPLWVICRRPTK